MHLVLTEEVAGVRSGIVRLPRRPGNCRSPGPDASVSAEGTSRYVVVGGRHLDALYRLSAHAHDLMTMAYGVPSRLHPGDPCMPGAVSFMLLTMGGDGGRRPFNPPSDTVTTLGYETEFDLCDQGLAVRNALGTP
jgi:hypothetical protein